MADEDKAKAEKLAAAKKRVEALKKKKQSGTAAGASSKKEKGTKKDKAASDARAVEDEEAEEQAVDDGKEEAEEESKESKEPKESKDDAADTIEKTEKTDATAGKSDKKKKKNKKGKKDDKDDEKEKEEKEEKEDKAGTDEENDKEEAKDEAEGDEKDEEDDVVGEPTSPRAAPPSLSEQSRLRSASFRQGGPLSPSADGETAADIYRKQASRIDELERQNKRLAKENADAEKRWQKAEDALADTRDGANGDSSEVSKLKSEIAALTRQNTQLSARSNTRHGSSPSMSVSSPPSSELETQLKSKSQTIETMELELSRLRAQVERLSVGGGDDEEGGDNGHAPKHGRQEQVAALEEKLERAEKAAGTAQRELTELKRNLDRTSEKAVREGSARTSAETKLKTLEKEGEDLRIERDELTKKVEGLEKKVTTLTTLHKEHDARTQALRRDKEKVDKDLAEARTRLERVEAENLRLRKTDARDGGGTDDEHLDELLASSPEASERIEQLDRRVRELEAENTDLRSGIWHERRKELQVGPDDTPGGAGSRHFSDVDLSPMAGGVGSKKGHTGSVSGGGALGDFFSVLTGGGGSGDHSHHGHGHAHGEDDGLLDDDDDMEFDEEAFRRAHEEEARLRLERVREAKRALKNWEGWRLDLVESRQGGAEGIGPIFEI